MTRATGLVREQIFQNRSLRTLRRPGVAGVGGDFEPGADFNIFAVSGPIEVHYLFGHVTTLFGAGVAAPIIEFTPTVGAVQVAMCIVHAGLNTAAAGTLLTWSGLVGGTLTSCGILGHCDVNANSDWDGGFITLPAGIVAITNGVGDDDGVVDWYVSYLPLGAGNLITLL